MTEKSAKPQLRFAGFDDTWEQRKFDEVFDCTICRRMEVMSASRQQEAQKPAPAATEKPGTPAPKSPKIMTVRRYDLCSVKRLQSKEDIDKYVEAIREKLMKTLESCDGVQIN